MRLYKYLTLMFLLGMVSAAANATATDPGVGLRGDGASTPILGVGFSDTFTNTCADSNPNPETPGITNCLDYFNANSNNPPNNTFVALHLFFVDNPLLTYSCADSLDPFFTSCIVSGDEVTFSGGGGIPSGGVAQSHFSIFLTTGDTPAFTGVADLAVVTTPEPASALLFVIGIGAIALFLKRA